MSELKGVSLLDDNTAHIPLKDMKDGQLAVIRRWRNCESHMVGRVVQRVEEKLILIGQPSGSCYYTCFGYQWTNDDTFQVEILKPGTTLVVN